MNEHEAWRERCLVAMVRRDTFTGPDGKRVYFDGTPVPEKAETPTASPVAGVEAPSNVIRLFPRRAAAVGSPPDGPRAA